jgi:crossover junction endodeoxyribonuclease RuvC
LTEYYIGIDPGKSGGIAVINKMSNAVYATPMIFDGKLIDFRKMARWIRDNSIFEEHGVLAGIEKVGAMPGQGVVSMFSFGVSTGGMLGILGALEIPTIQVPPQRWKKYTLADTDKTKEAAITFCTMLYPKVNLYATERSKKPHSGICDALCIAHYISNNF